MRIFRRNPLTRLATAASATILAFALVLTPLTPGIAAGAASDYQDLGRLSGGIRSKFKFVFAADSHLGYGPANQNTRLAFDDITNREKKIAFAVVAGDITETGAASEYALFKEITSSASFPIMAGMGNHEARWQDPQGVLLETSVGPKNYSFDYGSWHFVVLDSTYPGQTLGTLDPKTITWLETDLRSQPRNTPTTVFCHHPLLYEANRFLDSDDAFAAVLDKYQVRAIFCAHGHSSIVWKGQGRDFLMTGALMDGAYTVVEVDGRSMTAYSVQATPEGAKRDKVLQISSSRWGGKKDPLVNPICELALSYADGLLSGRFELSQDAEVSVRVNGGGYNPLGTMAKGSHEFSLDVSGQAKGFHRVRLKANTAAGPYYASAEFSKDASDLVSWRNELGSAVVGELLPRGTRQFIAGTRDGKVRLVNALDGAVIWEYGAGAQWGGGVIDGKYLYFGTAKGEAQCLNLDTGTAVWRSTLDNLGFAAPPKIGWALGSKRLYIGSSSGALYSLNAKTGAKDWAFQASGAIASAPEVADNYVVFGAWDGILYAVNRETGEVVWNRRLGRQMYYSPYLSPVVYSGRVFTTTPYDAHAEGSLLAAFDVATGQLIWKYGSPATLMSPSISTSFELVVPGANGDVYAFSPDDGSALWRIDGSSTLFSAAPGPGPEYVSGGYRGVVKFLTQWAAADFKVSDASLFVSPLILRDSEDTLVIQADSAGYLVALRFPL